MGTITPDMVEGFIDKCDDKSVLHNIAKLAKAKINSSPQKANDRIKFKINYMIGDADGDTKRSMTFEKATHEQVDAIAVVDYILNNHTEPNEGYWHFSLSREHFKEKPKEVLNILYGDEVGCDLPESYAGVQLTPSVITEIRKIVEELFIEYTEYSYVTYESHSVKGM